MSKIIDISESDIRGLDLNLLRVFDAVMRTGSVSRAAEELGMAQPSTSGQIGKLREALNDPLFVRESHGMAPTPFSENLYPYIRDALDTIGRGLKDVREFDPYKDSRTFTVIMTDIGETTLLPSMIRAFSRFGTSISFRAINLPTHETPNALKSGLAELAIAYMPYLDVGFFQRKLFSTDYICLARKGHPEIAEGVSMATFGTAGHVVAEARGTGHFYLLEQNFEALGIERTIKARVPNFMSIPHIVAGTDLLATVPRALGFALKDGPAGVCGYDHPVNLPPIDVKMLWHERFHKDAAHRWLRDQIFSLVQDIQWDKNVDAFMHATRKDQKRRAAVKVASGEKEERT